MLIARDKERPNQRLLTQQQHSGPAADAQSGPHFGVAVVHHGMVDGVALQGRRQVVRVFFIAELGRVDPHLMKKDCS